MKRDERPSVKNLSARPRARALALLAVLLLLPAAARAQWTAPDASGNVSSTNTGNVGIGTSTPAAKLDVSGDLRVGAGRLKFTFSGPEGQVQGATERISFSTPNAANSAQLTRMRFGGLAANSTVEFLNVSSVFLSDTAAKFGIGTSSPTSKFHLVSGTDSATSMLTLDTGLHGGTTMSVSGTANNESTFDLSVQRGGQYVSRFGVGNYGQVYLQPGGGNVGVGTLSPDIYSDGSTVNSFAFQAAGTNQHGQIAVAGTGTGNSQIVFGNPAVRRAVIAATNGSNLVFYVNNANSGVTALEAMRITSGGNVGIGTTSPQDRLHVNGSLRVQGNNVNGDITVMTADGTTGKWDFFTLGSNGSMGFYDIVSGKVPFTLEKAAPSNMLYVTAGGRVGVGNAAPQSTLDVSGQVRSSSGGFVFPDGTVQTTAASGSSASGWTDSGTSVNLTSLTAKVGLGTSGPTAGLDVQTPVSGATANGVRLQQTLTPQNNNGTLNALYINPTFNDGVAVGNVHNALATGAGNVGIGTTATGAGLDVQNAGVVSGSAAYGARFKQTIPAANNNTDSTAVMIDPTFSDGQAVGVRHNGLVVASGNVGIGTPAPASLLTVNLGNTDYANAGGANSHVLMTNPIATGQNVLSSVINGAVVAKWRTDYLGNISSVAGGGGEHHFWTGGDYGVGQLRMTIKNDGRVGIGTATPVAKLDVAGYMHVAGVCGGGVPDLQGAYLSWNHQTCGTGETDFINHRGTGGGGFAFMNTANGSTLTTLMTISGGGNVGVGTAAPLQRLQIGSNSVTGTTTPDAISLGATYSTAPGQSPKLRLWDTGNPADHPYGLGVSAAQLDFMVPTGARYVWNVNGVEKMRLDESGNVTVSGNIAAKYQDVAEWVPSTQKLQAGTVVVLDTARTNHVLASTKSYDTGVAGVISDSPGVILGEGGDDKLKVATTGRVKVRADATRGAIKVGDLLVTSDVEGVAMKSVEVDLGGVKIHRPGTIIGKALEPLASGAGEILVLLSLQ